MEVIFDTPATTLAAQSVRRPKKPTNRRAKSCRTCARRRVKCDGARPCCNRCKRGVFKCDGYEPDFLWIEEVPQPREFDPDGGTAAEITKHPVLDLDLSAIEFYAFNQAQTVPRDLCSTSRPFLENGSLLIDTLFCWQIYPVTGLPSQDATELALRACALSYWGHYHHDKTLIAQASRSYGTALKALSDSLVDRSQRNEIGVTRASLALTVYEVISMTTRNAWLLHAGGLSRMLQARGPDFFRSQSDLQVFAPISTVLILKHDIDRRRCFLEEPQWQRKFQTCNLSRDLSNTTTLWTVIRAVMSFIPGLVEDLDTVRRGFKLGTDISVQERSLRDRIIETLRGLFEWHRQWVELDPEGTYEVAVDPLDSFYILPSSGELVFESEIHFRSISDANALVYYHASVLRLMQIAENLPTLEVSISAALSTTGPYLVPGCGGHHLIAPHPLLSKEEVALELARSVPYQLLPKHRKTGAFALIWPLRNCLLALDATHRLKEWVKHVLQEIADNETFELSRIVTEYTTNVLQDLEVASPS